MGVAESLDRQNSASGGPVVVVGANCPLGKHLVDFLLATGRSVHGFYRSGRSLPMDWRLNPSFQGTEFDLNDASALERSLKAASQIVWLTQCREEPARGGAKDPNVEALNLVCAHPAGERRKIVLLSSGGSVYGAPDSLPVAETHPRRPLGAYGLSKKRLEDALTQNIQRMAGLSGVILRCANIYGRYYLEPGARGCIGAFARSLAAKEPVTLIAAGRAVRDFVHVSDVNRSILMALGCKQDLAVWNVGSGTGMQVLELLHEMCRIMGCVPAGFVQVDKRPADVEDIFLDIGKIRNECSWRPRIKLHEGLKLILRPPQNAALETAGLSVIPGAELAR